MNNGQKFKKLPLTTKFRHIFFLVPSQQSAGLRFVSSLLDRCTVGTGTNRTAHHNAADTDGRRLRNARRSGTGVEPFVAPEYLCTCAVYHSSHFNPAWWPPPCQTAATGIYHWRPPRRNWLSEVGGSIPIWLLDTLHQSDRHLVLYVHAVHCRGANCEHAYQLHRDEEDLQVREACK